MSISYEDSVATTDSPSTQSIFPGFTAGWRDGTADEFHPLLGQGATSAPPPIHMGLGVSLRSIPEFLGAGYYPYIDITYDLQPDFSRPWLYQGNNPSMPFNGRRDATPSDCGKPFSSRSFFYRDARRRKTHSAVSLATVPMSASSTFRTRRTRRRSRTAIVSGTGSLLG